MRGLDDWPEEQDQPAKYRIRPGHFVPVPGRKGTPGPYWECWRSECGAWFKDHLGGKCPSDAKET